MVNFYGLEIQPRLEINPAFSDYAETGQQMTQQAHPGFDNDPNFFPELFVVQGQSLGDVCQLSGIPVIPMELSFCGPFRLLETSEVAVRNGYGSLQKT